MTLSQPTATGDPASFVTDQWRTTSLATVWLHPGDWHALAARPMVAAAVSGVGVDDAAATLGRERAVQGVGLREALADLGVLFGIVAHAEPPFSATTSFADAWAEATTMSLLSAPVIDARTGVTTRDYLVPRVRELYAEASVRGIHPNDERCLIVIDKSDSEATGWRRTLHEGKVGRVLNTVLDRGQTNSILPSGTFLSLVPRDDALDEHVVRIRRALSSDEPEGSQSPVVRVHPLPATVAEVEELLFAL